MTPNGLLSALVDGPVAALYDEIVWMGLPDASSGEEEGERNEQLLPCRNRSLQECCCS